MAHTRAAPWDARGLRFAEFILKETAVASDEQLEHVAAYRGPRRFAKIFERIKVQDGQTLSPVF
jgi:hypothetical protein